MVNKALDNWTTGFNFWLFFLQWSKCWNFTSVYYVNCGTLPDSVSVC